MDDTEQKKETTTPITPVEVAPAGATPVPAAPAASAATAAATGRGAGGPARRGRFGDRRGSGGPGGYGGRGGSGGGRGGAGGGRRGRGKGRRDDRPQDDFESKIIDLARVTRVMAGGKRMRFRACVVVGDKKGHIGMAVMKGADVQLAVAKATDKAKRSVITVKTVNGTIPHRVEMKFKSATVLLKPAKPGTGIIAGGPIRIMMSLAGIENVVSKMKGSGNKINNVHVVLRALESLSTREELKSKTA